MVHAEMGVSRVAIITTMFVSIIIVLTLSLSPVRDVHAVDDNVTVDVNVSYLVEITVTPINLTWYSIIPGSDGTTRYLNIKNTGSANVSQIYPYTDAPRTELTNPLGTGNITNYAASGLLFIKNETVGLVHSHVGRLEWNISDMLSDENLDLTAGVEMYGHGWYRNTTGNWYLWKVENGSNGFCNDSDTNFRMIIEPENATSQSRSFTLETDTGDLSPDGNNANWSTFSVTSGPLNQYCIAAWHDCTRIMIYKYNFEALYPACNMRSYLREAILNPGEEITDVSLFPSVPKGTPAGDAASGTLTIKASPA